MRRRWCFLIAIALCIAPPTAGAATRPAPAAEPAAFEPLRLAMKEPGTFGGRFVIAVPSDPRTFNPILATDNASADVTDRLFTALTQFDNATQEIRPALARAWEVSADGLTWTWHLRRGARFSDGQPITAQDVRFSFDVAADTALGTPIRDAITVHGAPIRVTVSDPHTVVTRLAHPFALMPATMSTVAILPAHVLEPVWRVGRFASSYGTGTPPESLVTSGAWKLGRYAPHEQLVLERRSDGFEVDARGRRLPYLDRVIFVILPDPNAGTARFLAPGSDVDGLDNVRAEDRSSFLAQQSAGDFTLHDLGPTLTSTFLWFNLNTVKTPGGAQPVGTPYAGAVPYSWFSNRDFRRAVSMAIDRDAIIRAVYFGAARKSWAVTTPGNRVFYDPAIPAYDYDPRGARALLQRAGFRWRDDALEDARGNRVQFTLQTNSSSAVRVQIANFVRDDLARLGIACTVAPLDFAGTVGHIQNDFQYQMMLGGIGSPIPPDPGMGPNFYRSSGATHFWNIGEPTPATRAEARVDSLFELLDSTRELAARKRLASAMDRAIAEECWVMWLPVPEVFVAARNRFGNLAPSPIRQRLLWNIETVFVRNAKHR